MKKTLAALLLSLLLIPGSVQTAAQPGMQLTDFANPIFEEADPLISRLRMENNLTDTAGLYTWSDTSGVAFSGVIFDEGSFSAAFDAADVDEIIASDNPISQTVKSIECRLYLNSTGGVDYVYWAETADATYGIRIFDGKIWQYVSAAWSAAGYGLSVSTWYNVGVNFDGSDVKMYIDNTERLSASSATQPTNKTHYWGAYNGATGFVLDGYLDNCLILTAVSVSFPN
jgi:hypothetical protein